MNIRFAVPLLLASVSITDADLQPERQLRERSLAQGRTFTSIDGTVEVQTKPNFNTAEYFIRRLDGAANDKGKYKLKFNRFYESDPNSGSIVGNSNIGLSSLKWSLQNDQVTNNTVTFDIVATDNTCSASSTCCFSELKFHNKVQNNQVKFDINITGYQFCQTGSDINLQYKFNSQGKPEMSSSDEITQPTSNTIYLAGGNAYFASTDVAYQNSETTSTVPVTLGFKSDGSTSGITNTYSNFTGGDLFHDPSGGISDGTADTAPSTPSCFPPETITNIKNKGTVAMKDLRVGDEVLTGSGQYQTIYAIDHYHPTKLTNYLQIHTTLHKERPLEITPNHMIFIKNKIHPIPASQLKLGDYVKTSNNGYESVTKIELIQRNGLYNPLTKDGTIVVDGIVASTYNAITVGDEYVTVGSWKLPIAHQTFIHMSLGPLRSLCMGVSSSYCKVNINHEKIAYSKFGAKVWSLMQHQNVHIQATFISIAIVIFGLFQLLFSPLGICAVVIVSICVFKKYKIGKKVIKIKYS